MIWPGPSRLTVSTVLRHGELAVDDQEVVVAVVTLHDDRGVRPDAVGVRTVRPSRSIVGAGSAANTGSATRWSMIAGSTVGGPSPDARNRTTPTTTSPSTTNPSTTNDCAHREPVDHDRDQEPSRRRWLPSGRPRRCRTPGRARRSGTVVGSSPRRRAVMNVSPAPSTAKSTRAMPSPSVAAISDERAAGQHGARQKGTADACGSGRTGPLRPPRAFRRLRRRPRGARLGRHLRRAARR